jgi:hypothetical protein
MLFKISEKDIREDNNNIDTVPEFINTEGRLIKYALLMYDFESHLRKLPHDARIIKALDHTKEYGKKEDGTWEKEAQKIIDGKNPHLERLKRAIRNLYPEKSLEQDLLESYDLQIKAWSTLLGKATKTKDESDMAFDVAERLPKFMANRKQLQVIVGEREPDEAKEVVSMSTIDRLNAGNI